MSQYPFSQSPCHILGPITTLSQFLSFPSTSISLSQYTPRNSFLLISTFLVLFSSSFSFHFNCLFHPMFFIHEIFLFILVAILGPVLVTASILPSFLYYHLPHRLVVLDLVLHRIVQLCLKPVPVPFLCLFMSSLIFHSIPS